MTIDEASETSSSPPLAQAPRATGVNSGIAIVCAIVGLFIFPEIFDSVAIILGAYAYRRQQGNGGLYAVIAGILCMLIGLYFTAYVILGDFFP
jgi:hypothetical protein